MEKKYQVFVSSTYTDLKDERKSIQETLLKLDCIPAGMENFVAEDKSQLEVIKKIIDLCDYYLLIIGGRYGSIDPETQKSYTEMEYEYAISKNIPVLVFAVDENKTLKKDRKETDEEKKVKLKQFRETALNNKLAGIWENKRKLIQIVSTSITKAINTIDRPGWIRGYNTNNNDANDRESLLATIKKLEDKIQGQDKKIKQLSRTNKHLAFENYKIKIKYREVYRYDKKYVQKSKVKTKRTSLSEIYKYISLSISGYVVERANIGFRLKEFIKPNTQMEFVDIQIVDKLLNQYKELGFIEQTVEANTYKYKLSIKGEKIKNDLNLMEI
ncbi:MAG: DUF4062 domain-containing protein [Candidatus Caccovivens sp.]